MTPTTVLIAEDEHLAAEALADWVKATPGLQLVAVCEDGEEALAQIRALKPALVLTDIQMPGLTGLQVVQALQGDAHQPRIIFTTAYDQHALTAFELHAVDYLLKPFSRERFDEAVAHALRDAAPSAADVAQALGAPADAPLTRLLVRDQGKIFPLQVGDIESLRSDNKYTAITSKGRSFLVRLPIASFETRLDPTRFLRVQRGCIVNLDFVESMTPDENSQLVVQLRDGSRITANREVSKMLREQSL
ncbi:MULTISPECIES: LytTR family DNA-binding domain-containing protein [Roseateles]|uniref:Two-component system LytT family response regulator n=1 Tax=Pelomonas aquatica TaxID=431058 RepID=A0ABU1ZGB7_9BURK|nr:MULTISPECIES: LytTR family DNA-binding domain-containing protein [Roseateles]KQY85423.1 two-component system response regulator [Pelomonas sp. Root1444]MDR7299664.1 two-component system LytT family response regulator [Pelomonas aquatica]